MAVNNLVNLVKSGVGLTATDINKIMASFLMEQQDVICIQKYGNDHGHAFLKNFGAKVPRCSINQLHSLGLGKHFYKSCIKLHKGNLDQTLLN